MGGQGSSSSAKGGTGPTSSLSFVPALLGNAFFGTGIGLNDSGFAITGLGDFGPGGSIKGKKRSSIVDPFGLSAAVEGGLLGPQSGGSKFGNFALDAIQQAGLTSGSQPVLFGEGSVGGGQQGSLLNPFDLVSNLTDLVNPGINPAISGAAQNLQFSDLGNLLGNQLLTGDVAPTLQEGLQSGFKPDLQPIINEASRAFFSDIVPQLGQSNVALQEGVGPFSTDLLAQLANAGSALASQLGSLEVENQNRAADRRGELLGLSGLITDQLFNASTDAARNRLDLGEQLALQGTRGGRQATLLQLLAGQVPSTPIQSSTQKSGSKGGGGGLG